MTRTQGCCVLTRCPAKWVSIPYLVPSASQCWVNDVLQFTVLVHCVFHHLFLPPSKTGPPTPRPSVTNSFLLYSRLSRPRRGAGVQLLAGDDVVFIIPLGVVYSTGTKSHVLSIFGSLLRAASQTFRLLGEESSALGLRDGAVHSGRLSIEVGGSKMLRHDFLAARSETYRTNFLFLDGSYHKHTQCTRAPL